MIIRSFDEGVIVRSAVAKDELFDEFPLVELLDELPSVELFDELDRANLINDMTSWSAVASVEPFGRCTLSDLAI